MPNPDRASPSPERGGTLPSTRARRAISRWLRCTRGLTLIELLIVLAVIGILATMGFLVYANVTEHARTARAVADIANVSSEILTFEATTERLPINLAEIGRAALLDPWGRPYEYLNFSVGPLGLQRKDLALIPINTDFDLYSRGKDGVSQPPLTAAVSLDDIVRANDGQYIGLASGY
jgi:general secretion pathway protein G